MKAVVAAFNQEKALVGAFSVITNLRMELFEALVTTQPRDSHPLIVYDGENNIQIPNSGVSLNARTLKLTLSNLLFTCFIGKQFHPHRDWHYHYCE